MLGRDFRAVDTEVIANILHCSCIPVVTPAGCSPCRGPRKCVDVPDTEDIQMLPRDAIRASIKCDCVNELLSFSLEGFLRGKAALYFPRERT